MAGGGVCAQLRARRRAGARQGTCTTWPGIETAAAAAAVVAAAAGAATASCKSPVASCKSRTLHSNIL